MKIFTNHGTYNAWRLWIPFDSRVESVRPFCSILVVILSGGIKILHGTN